MKQKNIINDTFEKHKKLVLEHLNQTTAKKPLMEKPWYNIDGETTINGNLYVYYAAVHHYYGESDVEVSELEVYNLNDPANDGDNVKLEEDPKILKSIENSVIEEYVSNQHEDGTFNEDGEDMDAYEVERFERYRKGD